MAAQMERLIQRAKQGDLAAVKAASYLLDELTYLRELWHEPVIESATLKRVRQSEHYPIWRLSHPFDPNVAVRLICCFPPGSEEVVLTVLFGDKAGIGDVFYDSVGTRADQIIGRWVNRPNQTNQGSSHD